MTILRKTGSDWSGGPGAMVREELLHSTFSLRKSACLLELRGPRASRMELIKKVAHTYRYYISRLGRAAIAAACSLTRFTIIPALAGVR